MQIYLSRAAVTKL